MGKGATDTCNLQRQLAPDRVGPDHAEPTFLQGISIKAGASKAHRFQKLYGCLDEPLLHAAWRKLNKNGAPGVDKETVAQYGKHLDTNIKQLVERLKRGDYRSRLIRRVYIPKGNGKERPLGIPVVEDRLLQGAVRLLLEAIYEADFLPASYGYRPGTGAQQAVKDLTYELQFGRFGYVVEADIKGFFDAISPDWLLKMLEERIDDVLLVLSFAGASGSIRNTTTTSSLCISTRLTSTLMISRLVLKSTISSVTSIFFENSSSRSITKNSSYCALSVLMLCSICSSIWLSLIFRFFIFGSKSFCR